VFADQAEDGPGDKHLRAQSGRLAIRLFRSDLALVEAEQVESEGHREEGGLGADELTHAKASGRQIVFEFLDALFDPGPPVVIAPDDLGRFAAIGHEDALGAARHLEQHAADRRFALAHSFAQHHEAPLGGPAMAVVSKLHRRHVFIERSPLLQPCTTAPHRCGQPCNYNTRELFFL